MQDSKKSCSPFFARNKESVKLMLGRPFFFLPEWGNEINLLLRMHIEPSKKKLFVLVNIFINRSKNLLGPEDVLALLDKEIQRKVVAEDFHSTRGCLIKTKFRTRLVHPLTSWNNNIFQITNNIIK